VSKRDGVLEEEDKEEEKEEEEHEEEEEHICRFTRAKLRMTKRMRMCTGELLANSQATLGLTE